jgi:hypothetical protein
LRGSSDVARVLALLSRLGLSDVSPRAPYGLVVVPVLTDG